MRDVRVAALQLESAAGDKAANFAKLERYAEEAAGRGAEILVAPECFLTGYWFLRRLARSALAALAEPVPGGPSCERLRKLAARLGITVGVGLAGMPGIARAWTVGFLVASASAGAADAVAPPVVVQGAMPIEVDKLASRLDGVTVEAVGAWTFWRGTLDGRPVVVSKTLKGGANAAAATALAVERFHPAAILNQGTAGGHDPALRVYDVVLGASAVSLGSFKSPYRSAGAGSAPLEWVPLALTASEGSAGSDPRAQRVARFAGDEGLLAAARRAAPAYKRGRVVEGVIGSSDSWNSEIDLIASYRSRFGTSVEEMETAPAAQVAALLKVPFLGIRVVSNNITNGGAYDAGAAEACEDFVYEVVKAYLRALQAQGPRAPAPTR